VSTEHLMGVYNRAPLEVDRGQGARLWSTDGTEYLDCVMGISTNALGHANPVLVEAVKAQAEKLWHVSNMTPCAPSRSPTWSSSRTRAPRRSSAR
jgi:acetylornithine/N-succinyldiaminopimelate aminotransferase